MVQLNVNLANAVCSDEKSPQMECTFSYGLDMFRLESDERLHVHLTTNESKGSRWEVPHTLLPRPPLPQETCDLQPAVSFDSSELSHTALLAFSYTR
jgi:hypothetical protein